MYNQTDMDENGKFIIHKEIYNKLDVFYKTNKIPHIIFHGLSGSGKRTIMNDFLNKIYQNDKQKIKLNVMIVNCSHGKGIKFIREELKFFAKANIQYNSGILFKSVVLLNADFLTTDAQSALRRCIELFSYNTRFFILVENKEKLLNPILSRFCDIYVPSSKQNLHSYYIHRNYIVPSTILPPELVSQLNTKSHQELFKLSSYLYEKGYSVIDFITHIKNSPEYTTKEKSRILLGYERVRTEFRSEKNLFFYMMDFIRSNKEIKMV